MDDRSKVVGGAQRIGAPDGYLFPLSIESGLVYMHSIWVPNNDDLQQYAHIFFVSLGFWDASVLNDYITPAFLDEINHETDESLLQDTFLMNLETFNNK